MSDERSRESENFEEPEANLPLLDKLDRVIASLPPGDPMRRDLLELRPQVFDQGVIRTSTRFAFTPPIRGLR